MALEPITIFTRRVDPGGVLDHLRQLCPDVVVEEDDAGWRSATVAFGTGKERRTLKITHSPDYYAEPSWSKQMNGMAGYFSRFPDSPGKERVMLLITTFQFSLGTLFEPDYDPEGDRRLDILFDITEFLDGVLFTPSSLRDAHGRILCSMDGEEEEDADAVWPRVQGEVPATEPLGAYMHERSRPRQEDEVEEQAQAPTPARVARRALALTAVTLRAILERDKAHPEACNTYAAILCWIDDIGIGGEFEPGEWEVLQRPLGRLDNQMQINSTWRLEGLVVLAWALRRFELPPHDELVDSNPLWSSLGLFNGDASRALLAGADLRPLEEINELRNRLFALHWRLRNFHLDRQVMDFAEFARTAWFGPLDIRGLPLVDGDLGLQGKRLDRANVNVYSLAHSAAQERHQAANWLYEGPELYSEASVAT
ncbi:MAG: DUF4272 domain-containing protein [Gemmataceae bacterium]